MDVKSIKPHDWLIIGAAAVMLIFGMALDWASVSVAGASASGNGPFDYFFTGGLAWLLVSATGVIVVLLAARVVPADTVPWNLVFVAAAGIATLLMLLRIILGGGSESEMGISLDLDRGPGMYVALVAAAATLGGTVWRFVSSGGDLKELTDANTYRSSFKRSE